MDVRLDSLSFERPSEHTDMTQSQAPDSDREAPGTRDRESSDSRPGSQQTCTDTGIATSIVRPPEQKKWWRFTLRSWNDDQEQDWWFAGTAIPLLAATLGIFKSSSSLHCACTTNLISASRSSRQRLVHCCSSHTMAYVLGCWSRLGRVSMGWHNLACP
jgi:hypothetical protein